MVHYNFTHSAANFKVFGQK